jgi:hypothetical protein
VTFPAPSVAAPTLTEFQWSLGGLTIGSGQGASGWGVQYVDGLGTPPIRSSNPNKPIQTGEFTGSDFFKGRDLTLLLLRFGGNSYQLGAAIKTLSAAFNTTVPSTSTPETLPQSESPLWFYRPGFGQLVAMVRGQSEGQRSDVGFAFKKTGQPLLAFHATDPRLYGPTVATILSAPSPGHGLTFPFTFPIVWGGGASVSEATIHNTGTMEMKPIVTITGPCQVPAFGNASISGNPVVAYDLVMNAGDKLVVDMEGETALYYTAGSSVGVSRDGTQVPGSTFWNLLPDAVVPGGNVIQFSTSDQTTVTAACEVDWAPAYSSAA